MLQGYVGAPLDGFFPPVWKNMCKSNWIMKPQVRVKIELPPPSYRSMLIYSQYFTIHFFVIFGPLIWMHLTFSSPCQLVEEGYTLPELLFQTFVGHLNPLWLLWGLVALY